MENWLEMLTVWLAYCLSKLSWFSSFPLSISTAFNVVETPTVDLQMNKKTDKILRGKNTRRQISLNTQAIGNSFNCCANINHFRIESCYFFLSLCPYFKTKDDELNCILFVLEVFFLLIIIVFFFVVFFSVCQLEMAICVSHSHTVQINITLKEFCTHKKITHKIRATICGVLVNKTSKSQFQNGRSPFGCAITF